MEIAALIISMLSLVIAILVGWIQHNQLKIDQRPYIETVYKAIYTIARVSDMYGFMANQYPYKSYDTFAKAFQKFSDENSAELIDVECTLEICKNYIPAENGVIIDKLWENYNQLLKFVAPFLYDILTAEEKEDITNLLKNIVHYCENVKKWKQQLEPVFMRLLRI